MTWNVWASLADSNTTVCADARVYVPEAHWYGTSYVPDVSGANHRQGQGGWRVGVPAADLADLAARLERGVVVPDSAPGCGADLRVHAGDIDRLALAAHGDAGGGVVDGGRFFPDGTRAPALTPETVANRRPTLERILRYTSPNATVFLTGCQAGQGPQGTALLLALSALWPTRTFVAFANVLASGNGSAILNSTRSGCSNPGFRDTGVGFPGAVDPGAYVLDARRNYQYGEYGARRQVWDTLAWADEHSPGAKVVRQGAVLRGAGR